MATSVSARSTPRMSSSGWLMVCFGLRYFVWALQVTEAYEALIRQGMKPTDAIWYIEAKTRLPDWLPQPPEDDHDDDELDY